MRENNETMSSKEKSYSETMRGCDFQLMTYSEKLILKATVEVENLGADERLSDAVSKLTEARNLVTDFINDRVYRRTELE